MKRTFTFLFAALLACVSMVKAQTWLQPTASTETETYEYYLMNYRNQEYFATTTSGLAGGAQQLGSAKEFTEAKAKVTFKLTADGKLYSTNTAASLILGYTTTGEAANSVQLFAADSQEGYTWNIEESDNGGYSLNAGTSNNSWNMHGGAGANIGLYRKSDGGSTWVFVPANEAAIAKANEDKAMCGVSTEYYYQIKNRAHSRMLAANASKATVVTTSNTSDLNQLWAFEEGENGTFFLRNAGQQKYLVAATAANTAWTVGEEGTAFDVDMRMFSKKNYTIHASGQDSYGCAHDANWNANGGEQVVRWEAVAEASQWYLEKTSISTTVKSINFVYSFTFNGEEISSQACAGIVGEAYPEVNVPFGFAATKPEGELTAEVEGTTKVIALELQLPFVAAADVESIDTWYYVRMHSNFPRYIEENEDGSVDWVKTSLAVHADSQLWGFVGNVLDGFKLVNKGTGHAITSTSSAAAMGEAANATAFVLSASAAKADAFCLKYPTSNYLNASSGKVSAWDANDAGSTFLLEVYSEDLFDLSEVVVGDWVTDDETIVNPDLSSLEAWGTTIWNATNNTDYDAENGVMEFVAGENAAASLIQNEVPFAKGAYRLTGKAYHKGAVNAVMFVGDNKVAIPEAEDFVEFTIEFTSEGAQWGMDYFNIGYSCEFDNAEDVLVVGGFKLETKASMTLEEKFYELAQNLEMVKYEVETKFAALYEANAATLEAAHAPALEIFGALYEGKKVFKSAVKASVEAMETVLAADYLKVVDYYSGKFNTVYSEADQMLRTLEGTEAHATLQAAIPTDEAIAAVTEVAELEAMVAAMVAAMEAAMEAASQYVPTEVVLEHDAVIEIKVGETFQLVAKVLPATASQDVDWYSEDWQEKYITVSESGLVTAKAVGEVTITVESAANAWVKTECVIKVVDKLTDDIESIEAEAETVIYDLAGRRVEKMEKGIYIVNGKKVIK